MYLIREIIQSYSELIKNEENFKDGIYTHYFNNSKQVKEVFVILNGKRHGDYFEYYENGALKLKLSYKSGLQSGKSFLYNSNGILLREAEFENGLFINKTLEYFENGKKRMIEDHSNGSFLFYDEIGNLVCNIFIKCKQRAINDKWDKKSVWDGWIWNKRFHVIYHPNGIWRNYRGNGSVNYELDFNSEFYNQENPDTVLQRCFDLENNLISKEYVRISKIIFESFDKNFAIERLIEKHARYQTVHFNPGGWKYADFDINPIKELDDLILTLNSVSPPNLLN